MTIQECYKKMGADYQEVLGRLHNEAMIGRFVRMFLQDDSFFRSWRKRCAGET